MFTETVTATAILFAVEEADLQTILVTVFQLALVQTELPIDTVAVTET